MNKQILQVSLAAIAALTMTACGGGGGGGVQTPQPVIGTPSQAISYPYETVYGDVCINTEPTPGCTFVAATGQRVAVSYDPHYNRYGDGSDDLWFVNFNNSGTARVYNDAGVFQYVAHASDFAGYIGGSTIGVGTTGAFWENVANKEYFFGKNGVLYSGNAFAGNFGQAINKKQATKVTSTNVALLTSKQNTAIVARAAKGIQTKWKLSEQSAKTVASALNAWAVAGAERGKTTDADIDLTIKNAFGFKFMDALQAVKDFQSGKSNSAQQLTNRTANHLGIKPSQAKEFVKGLYKKGLAEYGVDADSINW
ncbi:MAG: hypothetical protein ACK5WZ_12455 [Pseudobdellovibrionaceae bacterium]